MPLTNLATSITFLENEVNAAPKLLDADVTFISAYSLGGARLVVSGLLAEDRISVLNLGTGSGQVGVSGSTISYGGTTIGTASGGIGADFTVTFNNTVTAAAVDAVIQRLAFADVSDAPSVQRNLSIDVLNSAGMRLGTSGIQSLYDGADDNHYEVEAGDFATPAFVDLNGDGLLDLVSGNLNGTLLAWRNTGTTTVPVFTALTGAANPFNGFDVGVNSAPAFLDLNADGKLDLVVGSYDGTILAWRNTGTSAAPVFTALTGTANPFNGVLVDAHLLSQWEMQNQGIPGRALEGKYSTPTFLDLNGDGRLDLVSGSHSGGLQAWLSTGTSAAPVFTALTGNASPFNYLDMHGYARTTPAFADLNGDGLLDLVVSGYNSSAHAYQFQTSYNTGTSAVPVFTYASMQTAGDPVAGMMEIAAPAFVDLDNDGYLNVLGGTTWGTLLEYHNTTTPPKITVTVTAQNDAPSVTSGATASLAETATGTVYQATGTDPEGTALSYTLGGTDAARFNISSTGAVSFKVSPNFEAPADAGGNNVYDITVIASDGTLSSAARAVAITVTDANEAASVTFAENEVNAAPKLLDPDVTFTSATSLSGGHLTVGGVLAEDRLSVLNLGNGAGQIGISGSTISYGGTAFGTASGGSGTNFTVAFNANATAAALDALIQRLAYANTSDTPTATRDLTINVWDAAGAGLGDIGMLTALSGTANPFEAINPLRGASGTEDNRPPAFVDLNGDGKLDLVTGSNNGWLQGWSNTGTSAAPVFTALTGSANPFNGVAIYNASAPAFVDLNSDGKLDLVLGGNINSPGAWYGALPAWLNTGTSSAPIFTALTGSSNPFNGIYAEAYTKPAFIDLNGDGKLDLVLGQHSGTLLAWRNTGTNAAPAFTALTGAANPFDGIDIGYHSTPAFVDLNGDDKLDLVVGEDDGTLLAWRNTGTAAAPVFTALTGTANPFNGIDVRYRSAPAFVDLNGDGKLDLVSSNSDGKLLGWRNGAASLPKITVNVTAQNDAPSVTSGATASFDENATGTVYQATGTDPDGTALSYTLGGTDAALFNISSAGAVSFKVSPNFEAPADAGGNNVYDITVTASDGALSTAARAVAITVTNMNEAPSVTSGATASVAENAAGMVYQATATDPEGTASFTWSLSGADAARFDISSTGAVTFRAAPDFEFPADVGANNIYNIAATASDGTLSSAARAVAITVTNVVEATSLTGLAAGVTFAENTVNATPQLLDADVAFASEASLSGGRLVVMGLLAEDRVSVLTEGNGAGQIGVSGSTISYGGVAFGTASNGGNASLTPTSTFTVTFNSNVTTAAVDALIQRLAYANTSDTPTATRDLTINVIEGTGAGLGGSGTLTALTGTANPFNGIDVGYSPAPAFVDLNGDGLLDFVSGNGDGTLLAWRNQSTSAAPVFTALTGTANPFNGFDVGYRSKPVFVNLDGDGLLDLVSGEEGGTLKAWRNTGTVTAPTFTGLTGTANPFNGIDVGQFSAPAFVDLNGDGLLDLVSGESNGTLLAWRNTGTHAAPVFAALTGTANPFNGIDPGNGSTPAFQDLNGDGLADLVLGESDGRILTWRNTGTSAAPVFTALTGTANPYNGIDVGIASAPAFVHLNDDGLLDLVSGEFYGTLLAWSKGGSLPKITVTVTAENDAPSVTSGAIASQAENATGTVYQATGTDPEGNALSYTLGGTDAARFDISSTGAVSFKVSPNFEAPADADGNNVYDITVIASDGTQTSAARAVAITVTNANEAPSVTSGATASFAENGTGTAYQATGADPEGTTLGFTLGGTDAALFNISSTGAVSFKVAPNFEAPADAGADNVYDITVTGSDGTLNSAAMPVAITVTNVVEAATLSGLAAGITFAENAAPQLLDADVVFTSGDSLAGGRLVVSGLLAEDRLSVLTQGNGAGQIGVSGGSISYAGTAFGTASGGSGADFSVSFNSSVTAAAVDALIQRLAYANTSDAPTTTRDLAINVIDSTGLGFISGIGPLTELTGTLNPFNGIDVGDRSTPAFVDLNGDGLLDLVSGEVNGTLLAWRNSGTTAQPVFTSLTGTANPFNGFDVGSLSTPGFVDLNCDGLLDLVSGESNGTLKAWRNTGTVTAPAFTELTGTANPFSGIDVGDRSTPAFVDLNGDGILDLVSGALNGKLLAWTNGASLPSRPKITVTVTAENDAPSVTSGATASFAENGTGVAYQAVAIDPEGAALSYTLGGTDAALFDISNAGAVTFKVVPNFEAPADAGGNNIYDITVTASDGALSSAARAVAITVTNVNDAPSVTSGATASFAENATGTAYRVTATDPERSALSYRLGGTDAALFNINAATGVVTFKTAPNFEAPADAGANNVYDIAVTASDGTLSSAPRAVAIAVTNVVEAPTQSGTAARVTFAENTVNAAPQLLGADVAFSTETSLSGGRLVVSGLLAEDQVSALSQGDGAGQIGVSGSTISYAGTAFGTASGGSGGDFIVTFNASVTSAAVDALIQRLGYANVSDTPTAARDLTINILDGAGVGFGGIGTLNFVSRTTNPFSGTVTGIGIRPAFVDLDGDGKLDVVLGEWYGTLPAWRNTGTSAAPVFTALTGSANPFNGIDVGYYSAPAFVDLDGDGKLDLVSGDVGGSLLAWRNTGTSAAPVFTALTGSANPFNGIAVGYVSAPAFVDLDGDGKLDLVMGSYSSTTLQAWRDTGTTTAPVFTALAGSANPFDGIDAGSQSRPAFVDLDGDDDLDLVVGSYSSTTLQAWRNTGTAVAPVFTALTGSANPFSGKYAGQFSAPAFADLNADGLLDLVLDGGNNSLSLLLNGASARPRITVTVNAENDAPSITSAATANFAENGADLAYEANWTDDGLEGLTWSLGGVDAALFDINSNGIVSFKNAPNFEAPTDAGGNNVYDITVTASDGTLSTSPKAVAITVTDVNEAPSITSGATVSFAENASGTVYQATGTDPDASTSLTWMLGGADAALFEISSRGAVTFRTSPNFEVPADAGGDNVYDITVTASDGALGSGARAVAITVTNVNEVPNVTSGATASFAENASGTVYQAAGSDPDVGTTLSYTLGGTDAALFDISSDGAVIFKSAPNFEAPADAGGNNIYDITVTASDGTLSDTKAVAMTVTDVNEAPPPILGGSGNDWLAGTSQADTILGGAGFDTLLGDAGDDSLDGGAGADSMFGGSGNDTYLVDNFVDVVSEQANEGTDTVRSKISFSLGDNVENLVLIGAVDTNGRGNALDNILTGNKGGNSLEGADGNDTLSGGAGNDSLDGGMGADSMVGGSGNDTYLVDNAGDVVKESGVGCDVVLASASFTLSANVEELTLLGGADLTGTGNSAANLLRGNAGANLLNGAAGNDTLLGGDGNDSLDGGTGADSMVGGSGNDTYLVDNIGDLVMEGFGEGIDTVVSSVSFTLVANLEGLTLTGRTAINGTGNELANLIIGNTGANMLNGGAGNDMLMGGLGKDTLTGGDGADVFRYGAINEGGDRITDFAHGVDFLELNAAGFGGGLLAGMDMAASQRFVAGSAASKAYGQFIYTASSSTLYWDADGIGAGAKSALASFTAGTVVTASDLHLV